MVFVAAGVLAHGLGFELLDGGTHEIAAEMPRHVAEIALVLVLLNDAARLDIAALRKESSLPGRLLAIGMPLTIALGGLVALGLFRGDLEFWEAILVAVILSPTDAALGAVVVSSPKLPLRLRQALNVEAGLNDGLAVPFFVVCSALAADAALRRHEFPHGRVREDRLRVPGRRRDRAGRRRPAETFRSRRLDDRGVPADRRRCARASSPGGAPRRSAAAASSRRSSAGSRSRSPPARPPPTGSSSPRSSDRSSRSSSSSGLERSRTRRSETRRGRRSPSQFSR